VSASSNIWRPPFVPRKTIPAMAPKRAIPKATTSIDDAAKAALLAKKKSKAALTETSLMRPSRMRQSTTTNITKTIGPPQRAPFAHAALREYLGPHQATPPRGRQHHRRRRNLRHFRRRLAQAASPSHQEQSLTEAERNTCSQVPAHHHAGQGQEDDTR
jgi:hypothetical protein